MANRYVLKFSKIGYAKYTSHLDLLRFFKRAFRKTGIDLRYSQGFNPHPKLGFAQPLSLGYSSTCELLEFETNTYYEPSKIFDTLAQEMPEGLVIQWCKELTANIKSLAGEAESAVYNVVIPASMTEDALKQTIAGYLAQEEIITLKRRKKDKKMVEVNIKDMIRSIEGTASDDDLRLTMLLDCGSNSNCSPELVIASFCSYANLDVPRYEMEVERTELNFYKNLQF